MPIAGSGKTPTKSGTNHVRTQYRPSPGEENLYRILDCNSPFHINDQRIKRKLPINTPTKRILSNTHSNLHTPNSQGRQGRTRNQTQTPPTPRQLVEWHECTLGSGRADNHDIMEWLGIIDWSLKSVISLRCDPTLDSTQNTAIGYNTESVRLEGISYFCSSSNDFDCEQKDVTSPSVLFHSSMYYWIYNGSSQQEQKKNHWMMERKEGKSSKKRKLLETTIYPQLSDCKQSAHDRNEWQQSFRSIYIKWIHRIQRIQSSMEKSKQSGLRIKNEMLREALDTYFYVINDDSFPQTILFRTKATSTTGINSPASPNGDVGFGDDALEFRLVPEIVISYSNNHVRDVLRSAGIHIKLLYGWDEYEDENEGNEFMMKNNLSFTNVHQSKAFGKKLTLTSQDKVCIDASHNKHGTKDAIRIHEKLSSLGNSSHPDNAQSELVGLRRAHLLGKTVGAEVEVSVVQRKLMLANDSPESPLKCAPPIVVSDWECCNSFVEIYLNTLGSFHKIQSCRGRTKGINVVPVEMFPTIVCRGIGPFLHSKLQNCELTLKKPSFDDSALRSFASGPCQQETIHIRGLILPCALRAMNRSVIQSMILADKFLKRKDKLGHRKRHYIMKAQLYIPKSSALDSDSSRANVLGMGCSSSKFFNGGISIEWLRRFLHFQNRADGNETVIKRTDSSSKDGSCLTGEVLKMLVWDSKFPDSVAYKLDYVDQFVMK